MTVSPIAARPPAPTLGRSADSCPSAAGAAFGALVDDTTAAVRTAAAAITRQSPPQQASAASKAASAKPDGTGKEAGTPASGEHRVPAEAEDSSAADPSDPAEPASGDGAADTLAGALADDTMQAPPAATPALPAAAKPVQAAAEQAAAVAIIGQPAATAAVETPAPKPSASKKQDVAAKADAKAQPDLAADASAMPMPMAAPQQAAAATITETGTPAGDEPLPSLSVAFSGAGAKGRTATTTAAASADGDAAAGAAGREAAPSTSNHELAQGGLSSTLLAQSVPADTKPASFGTVYAANLAQANAAAHATVAAQTGRIGHDMGVEIARSVAAGRHEILVRLDPPEMGRIEVRMSFDRDGGLRAVVAADSQGALDLLKRDTPDLVRALSDAGVRSDAQSFRFDTRSGDSGQQWRQAQQDGTSGRSSGGGTAEAMAEDEPVYRQLRTSGRIDMMA